MRTPKTFLRILPILTFLILVTLLFPVSINAQPDCIPSYEAAVSSITDARLGQGLENKLLTKIKNSWRTYQSGKKNSTKNALNEIDNALRLLDSPATKQIAPQERENIDRAIRAFRDCLSGAPPVEITTLTVRAFFPTETGTAGNSAGAGVIIRVNDIESGQTGTDGTVTLQVPAGTLQVEGRLYPSSAGSSEVTVAAGQAGQVDLILEDGKELSEDTRLALDEAPEGVLNRNFTTFTLRFLDGDATVLLASTELQIELLDPLNGPGQFIQNLFALQADGRIIATNVSALRNLLLQRSGQLGINVYGVDARGRTHNKVVRFHMGSIRVVGTLQAPPSFPGLNVSGIFVTANILNTNLVFHAVSDAAGKFEFPLLPTGNMEFKSETLQNGKYYYGQGITVLNQDQSLQVNMLYTDDLVNGVREFTVGPLFSTAGAAATSAKSADASPAPDPATESAREQYAQSQGASFNLASNSSAQFKSDAMMAATAADGDASIFAIAGQQNTPNTRTAVFNVPQGTKQVTLSYTIASQEYPFYVLSQSIYNDTWSLAVRAGSAGQQDFYNARQINSQLSVEPVWQPSGTTGTIEETLDVEALAANSDTTLTLFGSAMNVGDSILPTSISATLTLQQRVSITRITADTVNPTTGDSSYYSLPRSGVSNTFHRFFTLTITKPATATISNLKVDVNRDDGGFVETVLDEGLGNNLTQPNQTTLRVRVTGNQSQAPTDPTTNEIRYHFHLKVTKGDGTEEEAERDSAIRHALWRMPDGFARYSVRDQGGDDWCHRGTYYWMRDNRNLLTRINDISGEHARNLQHATHETGQDIDMYHFYTFPGAVLGGDNYAQLRANVLLAVQTNSQDPATAQRATEARDRVIAFVNATRTGIDNLAALNTVARVLHVLGGEGGGLPAGWARDLLQTGATRVGTQNLNLNLGNWSNQKYVPRGDHNDHVHVALDRTRFF
jgi:hypothetical protein